MAEGGREEETTLAKHRGWKGAVWHVAGAPEPVEEDGELEAQLCWTGEELEMVRQRVPLEWCGFAGRYCLHLARSSWPQWKQSEFGLKTKMTNNHTFLLLALDAAASVRRN